MLSCTPCVGAADKKKKEGKVPMRDVKEKAAEEDKKKEKPKAHAPSHAKIRSIGGLGLLNHGGTPPHLL